MTVKSTTQALGDLALRFGEGDEESMSRPFGVSLLVAGHDENGPSLCYTDPSGTFWQCNAKAIDSGSEGADSSLQEQYNKDITTLQEAETIALSILKQVMEGKIRCVKCQGKSEKHERMMDLTVEIQGDIGTLEEALAQFTATEILDGDNKFPILIISSGLQFSGKIVPSWQLEAHGMQL